MLRASKLIRFLVAPVHPILLFFQRSSGGLRVLGGSRLPLSLFLLSAQVTPNFPIPRIPRIPFLSVSTLPASPFLSVSTLPASIPRAKALVDGPLSLLFYPFQRFLLSSSEQRLS